MKNNDEQVARQIFVTKKCRPLFLVIVCDLLLSPSLPTTSNVNKMSKGLTEGKRHEVIGLLKGSMSVTNVAKMMHVTRRTVYEIQKRYDDREGDLRRGRDQGRKITRFLGLMRTP